MKVKVNYFENELEINDEKVLSIEIENKKYFYRFIKDLYQMNNGVYVEDINLYVNNEEISGVNRLKVLINYFDFEFDSKKSNNSLIKYVNENIGEEDNLKLKSEYNRLIKLYKKILSQTDLPLVIDDSVNVESFLKNIKIRVKEKSELLDNLLLLIDYEKIAGNNRVIVCVNLKQYLSKYELEELYKYAIYNQILLILVDAQSYGTTLNCEKKLIIG